jgi:hypothetical protein
LEEFEHGHFLRRPVAFTKEDSGILLPPLP